MGRSWCASLLRVCSYAHNPSPEPPASIGPKESHTHGICLVHTSTVGAHRGASSGAGWSSSGRDLLHRLWDSTSACTRTTTSTASARAHLRPPAPMVLQAPHCCASSPSCDRAPGGERVVSLASTFAGPPPPATRAPAPASARPLPRVPPPARRLPRPPARCRTDSAYARPASRARACGDRLRCSGRSDRMRPTG